jgi:WXG100 family type VII secretion target
MPSCAFKNEEAFYLYHGRTDRLTPEELRGYARRYGQESQNTGELIGRLDGMINLAQVWESASSHAFKDQYEHLRPSFQKMQQLLQDIDQQLAKSATILEDTDQQIAGQINA